MTTLRRQLPALRGLETTFGREYRRNVVIPALAGGAWTGTGRLVGPGLA